MSNQPESASVGETRAELRLVCLHMPGCAPCAYAHPVAELLSDRLAAVEFIDCAEDYDALDRFGGEGTPYWCLLAGDEVVESLYPADDAGALFDFARRIDADLPRESFDAALEEGKRKADFIEACQAELAVRSPETDATELAGAARLKIAKPCLSLTDDVETRACLEGNAAKLEERLRERIAMPDGDTPARREVIASLPAMVDELAAEIADIQERARREQGRKA